MTCRTPFGVLAAALATAIVATSVLGCGGSKQIQAATAEFQQQIDALQGRVDTLEKSVTALTVPDPGVNIKLKGSGTATKIAWVHPENKPVCKEGKAGCPQMVNWHLMSDLEEGWTVVMRESANTIDHDCFKPPADGWVLKKKGDSVSSGPTYCEEGASWKYDVVLKQGNSEHDKVDPLFFLPFN